VITTALITLLALMALAIPVAAAMGVLGLVLGQLFAFLPLNRAAGEIAWTSSNEFLLVALPLFILLGELLLRSGLAEKMYGALARWLTWLPGGLMHSNIAACAMFAATSGSSLATAATVGAVALPQAQRFGYNERLFLGTLAAGGTLGILIPPSINMIIYAVLTNTSVPRLYLAGIVPGVLLALSFMVIVAVACLIRPEWGGRRVTATLSACIAGLVHLLPPLGIFLVVVGSIYAGLATPTEAASLGVMAGLARHAAAVRRGTGGSAGSPLQQSQQLPAHRPAARRRVAQDRTQRCALRRPVEQSRQPQSPLRFDRTRNLAADRRQG
jgi:tripartite ATP-independent transporter DctM subunit